MDFEELLSLANNNEVDAKYNASKINYSTEFAPAKKQPKAFVKTAQIRKFLAKKDEEEKRKAAEAQRKKENLLALRAQNTKSNKKAKLMTSRTKDNDFSRIKLTEEEIEAKQKRERELQALELKNKRERMIARIELEEREKLLPRKRKRKNKEQTEEQTGEDEVNSDDEIDNKLPSTLPTNKLQKHSKTDTREQKKVFKRPPPPPPVDFHDLLKVASKKQFEPVKVKTVEIEGRPLTKKEKKALEEEEARVKRRLAAEAAAKNGLPYGYKSNGTLSKSKSSSQSTINNNSRDSVGSGSSSNKMKSEKKDTPSRKNPSTILHQKDKSKSLSAKKFGNENSRIDREPHKKVPSSSTSFPTTNNYPSKQTLNNSKKVISGVKRKDDSDLVHGPKRTTTQNFAQKKPEKIVPSKKYADDPNFLQQQSPSAEVRKESNDVRLNPKVVNKNSVPNQKVQIKQKPQSNNVLSEDLLTQIENRLREKMEKEMEEKLKKMAMQMNNKMSNQSINRTGVNKSVSMKTPPSKSSGQNSSGPNKILPSKKPISHSMKKDPSSLKKPPTKAFHPNPYLLPPRRLLESQRPSKPPPRRIVESDDDEEDDDDMDDFIDNEPYVENEDYSKYIREIFNYDRSRFEDDDDEDIPESNFAQVCQEENRSAREGYREDREEEMKQAAERKRMLMKKKRQ